MKRIRNISPAVQVKIVRTYNQKKPNGRPQWKLKEIAEKFEISLSTLNKLIKMAQCDGRTRGVAPQEIPPSWVAKILRDYSEPGTTMEQVGRLNPRRVKLGGKTVNVPRTRSQISKLIIRWKPHFNSPNNHSRGFRPGDKIEWATLRYIVVEYKNSRKGSVIDLRDFGEIKTFHWFFQDCKSTLVEATRENLTPDMVRARYVNLRKNDGSPNSQPVVGAADQR